MIGERVDKLDLGVIEFESLIMSELEVLESISADIYNSVILDGVSVDMGSIGLEECTEVVGRFNTPYWQTDLDELDIVMIVVKYLPVQKVVSSSHRSGAFLSRRLPRRTAKALRRSAMRTDSTCS